jgi:hypothetical protein
MINVHEKERFWGFTALSYIRKCSQNVDVECRTYVDAWYGSSVPEVMFVGLGGGGGGV